MTKTFSISEAKDQLPRIVHEAEAGGAVALTRRGKPVAVLISKAEYDRLQRRKRRIDWGDRLIDTRGFKFDRDEANAR
ncbi:MAG: type II toxin-antitoxin system Phd/YefM family antitoxin [Burkholderiales bacterium]